MIQHTANKPLSELLSVDEKTYNRRQDVPKYYDMTTVAYVTRPEFILLADSLFPVHLPTGKHTGITLN